MPEDILDPEVEDRGEMQPLPSMVAPQPQAPPAVVPQRLTPTQQQFLAGLAAQPQAASFYQPAQSFDDPRYQKSLFEWEQEVRRKAEAARAEQAINAGIRYIYQRRYDEDLKQGIPEAQAFSRMMMGIAMHTPKTDPLKMYEAFRSRPAPQPQMMQFGTNQVPGVLNVGRGGEQRWTPIPASALPPQAPGEPIKRYDPDLKRWLMFRNGAWYPATGEETARLTPLEKAVETVARKSMVEASGELEAQAKRTAPNTNTVARATQQFQNASNMLERLDVRKKAATPPPTGANRIRVISPDGKPGTVSKANLEEALKAGYKRE